MNKPCKTLSQCTSEIVRSLNQRQDLGVAPSSFEALLVSLQAHLGGLANSAVKVSGRHLLPRSESKNKLKQRIANDLVDIVGSALYIAHDFDIDVATAWDQRLTARRVELERYLTRIANRKNRDWMS